jgi:hypothetical protein
MNQEINLNKVVGASFAWHAENGEIIIDECDGLTIEQGLSMFDHNFIVEAIEASRSK